MMLLKTLFLSFITIRGTAGPLIDGLLAAGLVERVYPGHTDNVFLNAFCIPFLTNFPGIDPAWTNITRYYAVRGTQLAMYVQVPIIGGFRSFSDLKKMLDENMKKAFSNMVKTNSFQNLGSVYPPVSQEDPNQGCGKIVVTASGIVANTQFYGSQTGCTTDISPTTGKILGFSPELMSYYIYDYITYAGTFVTDDINYGFPESKWPYVTVYGSYLGFVNSGYMTVDAPGQSIGHLRSDMFSIPECSAPWQVANINSPNFSYPSNTDTEILTIYNLIKGSIVNKTEINMKMIRQMAVTAFIEEMHKKVRSRADARYATYLPLRINDYLYSVIENYKTVMNDDSFIGELIIN